MPQPAQAYCYCPAALQELRLARAALVEATNHLRARDPDYDAREALKTATHETREARELCNRVLAAGELLEQLRRVPERLAQLARIEEVLPSVERIEELMALIQSVDEIKVVRQ